MKKVLGVLLTLVLLVGVAYGATVTLFKETNAVPFSAVTQVWTQAATIGNFATGDGTTYTLGIPMSQLTCAKVFTAAPATMSATSLVVEGAIDTGPWQTLITDTATISAFNNSTGKIFTRIRARVTTLTKAAGTASMYIKCVAAQ